MSLGTIEARLVSIGDVWNGEVVTSVANNPFFPEAVDITTRERVVRVRRDTLLSVERSR